MDVISDTGHDETVTDIDVVYVGGALDNITLVGNDTWFHDSVAIHIAFIRPPRVGSLTLLKRNMLSFGVRKRVIHYPAPAKKDDTKKEDHPHA